MERATGFEPATPSLEGWRSSQLSYSRASLETGGEGRIRTSVGLRQRVYSPSPLATRVPPPISALSSWFIDRKTRRRSKPPAMSHQPRTNLWSHRRDSNPRQADYKSATLPAELRWRILRYPGANLGCMAAFAEVAIIAERTSPVNKNVKRAMYDKKSSVGCQGDFPVRCRSAS